MFGDRMKTSAIPERVYALCKEVSVKHIQESVLKGRLEPSNLGGNTSYFGTVKAAAEELNLISVKENIISLAVNKNIIENMNSFRHYINMNLEMLSEGLFYKVTREYLDMGTEVLMYTSVSKMCDVIGNKIGIKVIEDDMRAWRFWMNFLGFGYMHDSQPGAAGILLPNTAILLKDIIENLDIKIKTEYTVDKFINLIQPYANITLNKVAETKKFNYGFSNALRTLHDLGVIKAEAKSDAKGIWLLYPFEGHELASTITHITIGG